MCEQDDFQTIFNRARVARECSDITTEFAAEQLGISVAELLAMEAGDFLPSTRQVVLMSEMYNIQARWLVLGNETYAPKKATTKNTRKAA